MTSILIQPTVSLSISKYTNLMINHSIGYINGINYKWTRKKG